jgi:hypothetical protein
MPKFFVMESMRTRRLRLRKRLMEIAVFIAWICYGVLAHLESWCIVPTWHVVLYIFFSK